jgi:hypothetical protein
MKPSHKRLFAQVEEIIAGLGVEIPALTVIDVTVTADDVAAVAERLEDNASEGPVSRRHKAETLAAGSAWSRALSEHLAAHPGDKGGPILYLTRLPTKSEIAVSEAG